MKRLVEISKKMNVTEIEYVVRKGDVEEERVLYVPGIIKNIGDIYAKLHEVEDSTNFILKNTFTGRAICTLSMEDFLENADIEFVEEQETADRYFVENEEE